MRLSFASFLRSAEEVSFSFDWEDCGPVPNSLVGPSDSLSPVHYDQYDNIYLQVAGEKHFLLFDPGAAEGLYPFPVSHPYDEYAMVDLEHVDCQSYPRARELLTHRGAAVTLRPGESLFIPTHWWHHVQGTAARGAWNISVNFWFAIHEALVAPPHPLPVHLELELARHVELLLSDTCGSAAVGVLAELLRQASPCRAHHRMFGIVIVGQRAIPKRCASGVECLSQMMLRIKKSMRCIRPMLFLSQPEISSSTDFNGFSGQKTLASSLPLLLEHDHDLPSSPVWLAGVLPIAIATDMIVGDSVPMVNLASVSSKMPCAMQITISTVAIIAAAGVSCMFNYLLLSARRYHLRLESNLSCHNLARSDDKTLWQDKSNDGVIRAVAPSLNRNKQKITANLRNASCCRPVSSVCDSFSPSGTRCGSAIDSSASACGRCWLLADTGVQPFALRWSRRRSAQQQHLVTLLSFATKADIVFVSLGLLLAAGLLSPRLAKIEAASPHSGRLIAVQARACRSGSFAFPTAGHAAGHVQANLVILPKSYADDFRRFCANNAAACPLLEFTEPGIFEAVKLAPGSDLRKDLPKYHVWKHGLMVEERTDVTDLWQDDMQAFLLGCSFTWEDLLGAVQLTPRHVQENRNVPMFNTNIKLKGAGPFQGHMVVSMRPYKPGEVGRVADITGEYPAAHGRPVQIGEPAAIGINDVRTPDYGQSVTVQEGEVPVFWACGVTPQNALRNAKLPLVITHAPGHMLVADTLNEELKSWRVPGVWSARPDAE
ncbi:unnamed protein product [Polarella glacialis]|uniref:JmjC domain-containing protein n=1 Tax=Polarella glacialis TaxID=89957 RepID=A0A813E115_POLGL|nr:unnamed protein product [Polarella glacialis]